MDKKSALLSFFYFTQTIFHSLTDYNLFTLYIVRCYISKYMMEIKGKFVLVFALLLIGIYLEVVVVQSAIEWHNLLSGRYANCRVSR